MSTADSFRTHAGEIVAGARLAAAFATVADDWARMARAIRAEDCYASHVTEAQKVDNLNRDLEYAERIRAGTVESFTIWQRVDTVLTGECVTLLG